GPTSRASANSSSGRASLTVVDLFALGGGPKLDATLDAVDDQQRPFAARIGGVKQRCYDAGIDADRAPIVLFVHRVLAAVLVRVKRDSPAVAFLAPLAPSELPVLRDRIGHMGGLYRLPARHNAGQGPDEL